MQKEAILFPLSPKKNLQFLNLLLTSFLFFILSCDDPEIIEEVVIDGVEISVIKDNTGNYGGAGYLNEVYTEFQGCFHTSYTGDAGDKIIIQMANFEWIGNALWARRDVIGVFHLDYNLSINDTIFLDIDLDEKFSRIYKLYGDGQLGECFNINTSNDLRSWVIITEHDKDLGIIVGNLNADYILSETCVELQDETMPDTIVIRDLSFRSEYKE